MHKKNNIFFHIFLISQYLPLYPILQEHLSKGPGDTIPFPLHPFTCDALWVVFTIEKAMFCPIDKVI